VANYQNFDRQYRLAAGPGGGTGFEIGATTPEQPVPLHIEFSLQKSDDDKQNTGKVTVWNLNKDHLSVLDRKNCVLSLRAGYGDRIALVFAGNVSYSKTTLDSADRKTEIEIVDSLVATRDTYVSLAYSGTVSWKAIIDNLANQMGVAVTYSYNATFKDAVNGFSFVGKAKDALTKACNSCGLTWTLQNGVLQIKRPGDVMSKEVYLLNADTGLIEIPARVSLEKSSTKDNGTSEKQLGWEVVYFLNASIDIGDYVKLESKTVTGYFRVKKLEITGDNVSGDWVCKAQLLEVKG